MTTEADVAELKSARDVSGLLQALQEPNWRVRQQAAEALGELRSEQAIDPLVAAQEDENSNVRWTAVWALGQIGGERALQALVDALDSEAQDVQNAAEYALEEFPDPEAQEVIDEFIEVESEPMLSPGLLFKYGTYVSVGLAVIVFVLSFVLDWSIEVRLLGTIGLLVLALILWQFGGRRTSR